MKESARYVKVIEWSDEDQCFVGECPGIIGPCCHGDDETAVNADLCQIVEEWIEIFKNDGRPLPPPTAGLELAPRILAEVNGRVTGTIPIDRKTRSLDGRKLRRIGIRCR
ncbi:MAG: hypothetical protein ACLQGP_11300 [Isosphaeraceae bacterium]